MKKILGLDLGTNSIGWALINHNHKDKTGVNDFSSTCYFTPIHHSKAIRKAEVDLLFNTKKSKLQGSYDYKTASDSFGNQIKDWCIKILKK